MCPETYVLSIVTSCLIFIYIFQWIHAAQALRITFFYIQILAYVYLTTTLKVGNQSISNIPQAHNQYKWVPTLCMVGWKHVGEIQWLSY